MEQDQLDQSTPPTKVDTSVFRNGYEARDTDVFIAVMGMTGVGKSTLISLLTTQGNKPTVGSGLSSCTRDVEVFRCDYSPTRTVYLVDTPGFDDTSISDTDVLRNLAGWLAATYDNQIRLHGIMYLHRISDVRLGGSAKRNLRMFQKLCGSKELQNVILVTTMWNKVQQEEGVQREIELTQTSDFWGCMVDLGSRVERHTGDKSSANRLVGMVLKSDRRHEPTEMTLEIQKEIVDEHRKLQDTQAADEVLGAIEKHLQKCRKDMEHLQQDLRQAQQERDSEWEGEIKGFFDDVNRRTEELQRAEEGLLADMIQLMERLFEPNIEESDTAKTTRLAMQYDVGMRNSERRPDSRTPEPPAPTSTVDQSVDSRANLEEEFGRQHSASSSQFSLLRFKRASHSRHPAGSHWPKRTRRDIGLSLRGHHCSFVGPVHSKSYLPQSTLNTLVGLESSKSIRMKRIVLGESLAYFAHYHEGTFRTKCYYIGSVQAQYPPLFKFLSEKGNLSCPTSISLGPAGSYFIRVDDRRSFQCHPNAAIDTTAKEATRLWWGVDGAYVLEKEAAGQAHYEHELRGCYGDLEEILDTHGVKTKIWDLALNIEDRCSFAIVFEDGSAFHDGKDDVICSKFDEYANKHFGDMWGDIDVQGSL